MKNPSRTLWTLAGLTVLATLLRLVLIGGEPYWGDEILSLDIVWHFASPGEMVRYLSEVEFHPPLYYLMLWPWIRAFGESEAATRALSLIFSVATVPLTWWAGKRILGSPRAGLVAAGIVAVMPIMVEFGQEARPYAIQAFFITLALVALHLRLAERKRVWGAVYAVSVAIALYLHYSTFFFIGAAVLWWLIVLIREAPRQRWTLFVDGVIAHAIMFLLFLPWLAPFLYKLLLGQYEIYGLSRDLPSVRPLEFFEHSLHQLLWVTKGKFVSRLEIVGKMVFLIVTAATTAHVLRKADGRDRPSAVPFLVWTIFVSLAFFLFSPQSIAYSSIHHRHVLFLAVPLALLIGELAVRAGKKRGAVLLAVLFASMLPSLAVVLGDDSEWDRNFRYEEAGTYISAQHQEGDLVIVSLSTVRTDITHYLDRDIPVMSMVPYQDFGNDTWNTRETLGIMENESQVRLMTLSNDIGAVVGSGDEMGLVMEKLDRIVMMRDPKRIWLYAFAPHAIAHRWFEDHGWRHAIRQVGGLFRVDLYVAPEPDDAPTAP